MQYIAIIVIASYILFLFLLWIFFNYKHKSANNSVIITIGFSLLDVVSDILSTVELYHDGSFLYIFGIVFLILPALTNHIISWFIVYKFIVSDNEIMLPRTTSYAGKKIKLNHPSFNTSFRGEPAQFLSSREWMDQNYILCALVVLLSSLNIENLSFLSSKLLGSTTLKVNWPDNYENTIRVAGVISNIFEDIPQLTIQIYHVSVNYKDIREVPPVFFASIVSGILVLAFSFVKRGLLFLLRITKKKEDTEHGRQSRKESTTSSRKEDTRI